MYMNLTPHPTQQALRKLTSPMARVTRDGRVVEVRDRETEREGTTVNPCQSIRRGPNTSTMPTLSHTNPNTRPPTPPNTNTPPPSQLPAEELVPGDIVSLKEGDQIPADVRLVDSVAFACEEAILTGESVAVSKTADALARDPSGGSPPLGDRKNMGFFGCVASRGRASAVVTATGMSTELGRIATSIG